MSSFYTHIWLINYHTRTVVVKSNEAYGTVTNTEMKSNEAYGTVTNTEMKSNEAYGVFHQGSHQQHNEKLQMPPLNQPPNTPPPPPNYANLNPPMVYSYVMISVKQEVLDEPYKEVDLKEEHLYDKVGASQMPTEDI